MNIVMNIDDVKWHETDIEYWKNLVGCFSDNVKELQQKVSELELDLDYERGQVIEAEESYDKLKRSVEFFLMDIDELSDDCVKILDGFQSYPSKDQDVKRVLKDIINIDMSSLEL